MSSQKTDEFVFDFKHLDIFLVQEFLAFQELLAFNPVVFRVIALISWFVEVKPGYYEKKPDSRKKKGELLDTLKDITEETIMTSENMLKKLLIEEEHLELWVWKFIDVNDPMNQVCEASRDSAVSLFAPPSHLKCFDYEQTS
ncbi:uncharacterized protein MELLADRAFT_62359 [Melampsora larici-populina 98AG31]|uniref:Uncharacterized protein n=1 Tax=Melampsora larici-populina (strain 98AG31 / pathotype 3-4-7) TaxID=747676 RepID=F4RIP4_MELLP|nr:uncharacterized protein MELLADRAFT_62359 [Melampsora larici-populina 98AG31]EGG07798.1 hypothetical protein MELLADRAFT_62359 [Melampsora larici-populina 98AG31]